MKRKSLSECPEFMAGDGTRLRELWNPHHDPGFGGRYSLAHATVPPQGISTPHRLATNEVYYILKGAGRMHIDSQSTIIAPGDCVEIPAGAIQRIENVGDDPLEFLCIVDPAWRVEDEEILGAQ